MYRRVFVAMIGGSILVALPSGATPGGDGGGPYVTYNLTEMERCRLFFRPLRRQIQNSKSEETPWVSHRGAPFVLLSPSPL